MGGLTNTAKSIAQQKYSYTPAPVTPTPTPVEPTPEETAAETRRRNLLSRDRGRFGTVQTGFRGLLSLASALGQRKTLLGE